MTMRDRLLPWSGLILGGVGWAISSQWGSWRTNDACLVAWPYQTIILGLIGFLTVLAGAWLSWLARAENRTAASRFIATFSLASDVVLGLAILFHTIATLIIPRCFS